MSLKKVITEDKIEIVGKYRAVQIRTKTAVTEDDVELSSSFHRHVVHPGEDYSNESAEVQAICNVVHTPAVIESYQEMVSKRDEVE